MDFAGWAESARAIAFQGLYHVYASTPIGSFVHASQLSARAGKPPHSLVAASKFSTCTVTPIPFLEDNYAYLIVDDSTRDAAVVDPADPDAVLAAVSAAGVALRFILTTHRHADHAGGNARLAASVPGLRIYGGVGEGVEAATDEIAPGATIALGGTALGVTSLPFHTGAHVAYVLGPAASGHPPPPHAVEALFSGDALFASGAGRFFEGTPAMAMAALDPVGGPLAPLPGTALMFSGHEYGQDNARFAAWLMPDDTAVAARLAWVASRRSPGALQATVPTTLRDERGANLFLRFREAGVQAAVASRVADCRAAGARAAEVAAAACCPGAVAGEAAAVATLGALRALKDARLHKTE